MRVAPTSVHLASRPSGSSCCGLCWAESARRSGVHVCDAALGSMTKMPHVAPRPRPVSEKQRVPDWGSSLPDSCVYREPRLHRRLRQREFALLREGSRCAGDERIGAHSSRRRDAMTSGLDRERNGLCRASDALTVTPTFRMRDGAQIGRLIRGARRRPRSPVTSMPC